MLRLPPVESIEPEWHTWDIAPGVMLELLLTSPTFADQFSPLGAIPSRIKDWRGVEDDQGEPLEYSLEALGRVLALHPDAAESLQVLVHPGGTGFDQIWGQRPAPLVTADNTPSPPTHSVENGVIATEVAQQPPARPLALASPLEIATQPQAVAGAVELPVDPPTSFPADPPEVGTDSEQAWPHQFNATESSPPEFVPAVRDAVAGSDGPSHSPHADRSDYARDLNDGAAVPTPATETSSPIITNMTPSSTVNPNRELAQQLQQATAANAQLRDHQQQLRQSLDAAWQVLDHLSGRRANRSQRAQLTGGGR